MGHEVERVARERGHEIVSIIDINNRKDFDSKGFMSAEAAIEFSRPDSALKNFKECFDRNMPLVTGTTGVWYKHLDDVRETVINNKLTFFYASNFSIGVNVLFAVNRFLARIMNGLPQYNVEIEEVHHVHKLDSPSGTGITIAEGIINNIDRKRRWVEASGVSSDDLVIHSLRDGETPGIHEIVYESDVDVIRVKHDAKNRSGFALGAVLAAEFIRTKKGFFTMNDMLNL
jgi:4-hydroxy-tetrahydrodipicolinate reductase